jgi:PAS domain S-box-containing protein
MISLLYVDDEYALLEIGKMFLEKSGDFLVTIIDSAPGALELLKTEKFDAIIADYQMPEIDGLEFLKQVRLLHGQIPFILFTGRGREEVVILALNLGADFYLQKGGEPVPQFAELAHKIQQAVKRKRSEVALHESEERFSTILNAAEVGIIVVDAESHKILQANPKALELIGSLKHEVEGIVCHKFICPAEQGKCPVTDLGQTVNSSERILITKNGMKIPIIKTVVPTYLGNKKVLVESFIDISDRKLAEEALKESEATLGTIFRAAPIGIGLVSNRILIRVNERLSDMTGYLPGEMTGKSARILYPTDEEFERVGREKYEQIRKYGTGTIETRWQRKDGTIRDIMLSSTPLDPSDREKGVTFTALDITGRKEAEEALKESEERFRTLAGVALEGIMIHDQGVISDCNPQFAEMFGYKPEALMGKNGFEFMLSAESRDALSLWHQRGAEGLIDVIGIRHDGTQFFGETASTNIIWKGKEHSIVQMRDITARKESEQVLRRQKDELNAAYEQLAAAEAELRRQYDALAENEKELLEREETFRSLVQESTDGIVIADEEGKVIVWNEAASRITGISGSEALNNLYSDLVVSTMVPEQKNHEQIAWFRSIIDEQLKSGSSVFFSRPLDAEIIRGDGERRYIQQIAFPIRTAKGFRIGSIVRDSTERMRAEEQNVQQSRHLSILNEIVTTANKAEDLTSLLVVFLDTTLRLLDYDAGGIYLVEPAGKTASIVHAKNLPEEFLTLIRTVTTTEKPYDSLFVRGEPLISGNYSEVSPSHFSNTGFCSIASIPLIARGSIIGALNIASRNRDIVTEQERTILLSIGRELGATISRMAAEDEVKKASKNLETLFNSIDEMIFVLDLQGHILVANDAVLKRLSYTSEELTGMDVLLLHVPELRDEALRNIQGMIAGTVDSCPVPVLARDGTRIEVETKITRGLWNGNEVIIGVTRDITRQKQAEVALRESELKYRSLIESSSDAIFSVDQNGEYKFTNIVFASTFNKTPEFFIGKTFWDIYPKEHADYRQQANRRLFETGETQTIEVEVPLPDTTLYFIAKANPIKDESGKVILNLTHATDITERKRAEQALQQANKKLTLLSGITRHDISNQLTILIGYLELIKKQQPGTTNSEYFLKVSTAAQRISSMIQFAREYDEIGVNAPAWQDCRMLVDAAAKQAPLGRVMVKNDLPAGAEILADPLIARVVYNLMDNAVRYGGTIATLRFSVENRDGNRIIVCEDDGTGVATSDKEKIFERGFGKNTGLGLALSKEILAITGITLQETGEPGKGARFEMAVPKGMWRIGDADRTGN